MTGILTWTAMKAHLGLSLLAYHARRGDRRFLASIGIIVAVLAAVAPMTYMYVNLLQAAYDVTLPMGQPQVVLTINVVYGALLVLLLGIAHTLSVFYFSNDLSMLVPLPVHPYQLLTSKLLVVMITQYLILAPFLLPGLILYGIRAGVPAAYWPSAVLVSLLVPVIPISVASLLTMLLVRIANLSRYKDTIRFAGLVLLVLLFVAASGLLTRVEPGQEAAVLEEILTAEEGLVSASARVFPPAVWATRALSRPVAEGMGWLGLYGGVSLLAAGITVAAGQWLFYGGLIGGEEVAGRRTVAAGALARRLAAEGSPTRAIMMRDTWILIRTPIYLFNSAAMIVLLPVILAIPIVMGQGTAALSQALDMARAYPELTLLGGAAFIAVMAIMGPASSSSFSREGKQFWVSKVIPVEARLQLRGKLAQGLLVAAASFPLVAVAGLMWLGWSLTDTFIAGAAGMAASLPLVAVNLAVDLVRPYLTWDNPQQAIKQNLNVVIGLVAGGALVYGMGRAAVHLLALGWDSAWVLATIGTASLVLGIVMYAAMESTAGRLFDRVEV